MEFKKCFLGGIMYVDRDEKEGLGFEFKIFDKFKENEISE